MIQKKVLLMGKGGAGKSSMRSIIFSNSNANDTRHLAPTTDADKTKISFYGNLIINLWECGGQKMYKENYYNNFKGTAFLNVDAFIYVFDAQSYDKQWKKDLDDFNACSKAVYECSPTAKIICLLHKMDFIPKNLRDKMFLERKVEIASSSRFSNSICYCTSIWNDSLYRAWSSIVQTLMPRTMELGKCLENIAKTLQCDEILLYERATFLLLSSYRLIECDEKKSDEIASILKKIKTNGFRSSPLPDSMTMNATTFSIYMKNFTPTTYILVVYSNTRINSADISLKLDRSRGSFEALEKD